MFQRTITGACAVLFDENCCDTGDTNFVIPRGGKGEQHRHTLDLDTLDITDIISWPGKMCGSLSSLNPLSSCQGPRLSDDVESLVVMPGCTLDVWDEDDGVDKQEREERVSFNAGEIRNAKDLYNKEKLKISAQGTPNWIEELNDDFNDLNEDIDSYRCTCN